MKKLSNHNVVWGILLIAFGITALLDVFITIPLCGWLIVLFIAGLFTGIINWDDRRNLVNFIPTYVLWAIAGLIVLIYTELIIGEVIPVYVLWVIGLPFLIGYLRDRDQWEFLVPAYVLFSVGLMVGLIGLGWLRNFLIPAYVMLAIAAPFFLVYLKNRENWWALIPAGIMSAIAVGFLFASSIGKYILPLLLVAIGIWIIVKSISRR